MKKSLLFLILFLPAFLVNVDLAWGQDSTDQAPILRWIEKDSVKITYSYFADIYALAKPIILQQDTIEVVLDSTAFQFFKAKYRGKISRSINKAKRQLPSSRLTIHDELIENKENKLLVDEETKKVLLKEIIRENLKK